MNTGYSQSQLGTTFKNNDKGPKQVRDEAILETYIQNIKDTLNTRYKELLDAKQNTTNFGDRYDLTIAINELKAVYDILFRKEH